jgi:hypothetical protein
LTAKKTQLRDHPYCLEPDTIRLQIGGGTPLDDAQIGAVRLRLPSTRSHPLPSPELSPDWELDEYSSPAIAPWLVRGLWLPAGKAYGVLANLPAESKASGFTLGTDARFWQQVCGLVLEILAGQNILPTLNQVQIEGQPDQYFARWLRWWTPPKTARVWPFWKNLCRPSAAAAEMGVQTTVGKTIQQSAYNPKALIDSFLRNTCDALARAWGRSRAPLLLPEKGNTLDIWLAVCSPRTRASTPLPASCRRLTAACAPGSATCTPPAMRISASPSAWSPPRLAKKVRTSSPGSCNTCCRRAAIPAC